jgi:hypothetical protein
MCTENLILIDYVTESPSINGDDRASPRVLTKYATYYNELRTHRSLNKDAPIHRAIQYVGDIVSAPVLGGLHHHYCRI